MCSQSQRKKERTIAVIGGDGRFVRLCGAEKRVRAYASSRDGGRGEVQRAIAAIGAGRVSLVVLLARWLGHSDFRAVKDCCAMEGVDCLVVTGGLTALRRTIESA